MIQLTILETSPILFRSLVYFGKKIVLSNIKSKVWYVGCEQRQTVMFIKTATIVRKQKQEEVGKTKKVQEKYKLHT